MKKNRPGTLLSVDRRSGLREALTATIFSETTTIGVRYRDMARECLDRENGHRRTTRSATSASRWHGRHGEVLNASPEFDDCARLAAEHDVPAKNVQALAMQAYLDARNRGL